MDGHVDWLTWTMLPSRQPENHVELYHIAKRAIRSLSDEHAAWIFDDQGYAATSRHSTFNICLARDDNGVKLGGLSPSGHILVEATGRACDSVREPALSRRIVMEIAELLTRFDYAVDVLTDTLPTEFANKRSHNAFRSVSFIRSSSGETVYIGSRKSDRFARVYRYNPPHPRAHLLRIEFVFRRGLARAAALQYCQEARDGEFLNALGNTFGWSHPDWQPGLQNNNRLNVPSVPSRDEDTVAWLYKQVAPALRRMLRSPGFDMTDWLETVYQQDK